jgi:lipopolysaccharide export system protein LptC
MDPLKYANRFRLSVILALAVAIALGSFWLSMVMNQSMSDTMAGAPRSAPDYYVEKFSMVKLTPAGQVKYSVSGSKLLHHPLDDSYDIERPVLHSLSDDHEPMTMHADRARVEDANSKIHMTGNVKVDRPRSATAEALHIASDYMLILPDDDIVQSDKKVDITLGQSSMSGIGMIANNASRELRLLNQARVRYIATH